MARLNCWELKMCGREPRGANVAKLGVCPAATAIAHDGGNGGKNAGRLCWAVAGTLCDGKVQGAFAVKRAQCETCDFFLAVKKEEGSEFVLLPACMRGEADG